MIPQKYMFNRTLPLVIQHAGAHRKPRWLPVAKSKIYRIPKRPEVPEDERLELQRINNNYKTQMRAIRRFYVEDFLREKLTLESATSEMSQRLEAEEWARCDEINDTWNAQVAAERDERRKKELAELEEYALKRMETKDKELQERIAKASERIRIEKELSATFITPENLEETINRVLANPVDYNFAIDLRGNKFPGRETPVKYEDSKKKAEAN